MTEITAAPQQCEKGQLPVLASASPRVLHKSPGASASAVFLCDAHHQWGTWHCRSGKVLNEISNQLDVTRFLLFSGSPGQHSLTRTSPWEKQLVDLELCSGITVSEGKEKTDNQQQGIFLWVRIISMPCFVLFCRLYFLIQQWFSQRYYLSLTTSPATFPLVPFLRSMACTLMPLNTGEGVTF